MDLIGDWLSDPLSFRLFAMFAGEVLGAVMLFLARLLSLPFSFLGILTAVVQPFVFSTNLSLYLDGPEKNRRGRLSYNFNLFIN